MAKEMLIRSPSDVFFWCFKFPMSKREKQFECAHPWFTAQSDIDATQLPVYSLCLLHERMSGICVSLCVWHQLSLAVCRKFGSSSPSVFHSISGRISVVLYFPVNSSTGFFKYLSSELGIRVILGRHSLNPQGRYVSLHLGIVSGED